MWTVDDLRKKQNEGQWTIDSLNNYGKPKGIGDFKSLENKISPQIIEESTPKKGGFLSDIFGKDARAEFDRTHQDTPNFLKPVGFALETFDRIPLTNRLMNKTAEFLGTERVNFDGSKLETKSTGSKAVDALTDVGANLIGSGFAGPGNGTNLLNATDDIAKLAGGKVATFTGGKLLPAFARGATDAASSVALEDLSKGNIKELPKDVAINAIGGSVLGGGGQLIGDVARKVAPSIGKILPDLTANLTNLKPKDLLSDLVTTNSKVTQIGKTEEELFNPKKLFNKDPIKADLNAPIKAQNPLNVENNINALPLKNDVLKAQETPISNNIDGNGIFRTEQKIVSSENSSKTSFKQKLDNFYTKFVDSNNSLKPLDKTYKLATNSKNVGGTVNYIMTDALVDKTGNKIGDSLQSLVKDIPNKDYNDFWEYALQKHNVQRATNEKNVFMDFTPEQSASATKKWEELHPEWKDKSNKITKWIDNFMNEWGVKAGTIDPELYTQMRKMYPDYIPTNRAFDDIEEFIPGNVVGKGFVNQNPPIKKATGSKRDVIDPLENIMNLVNRTVRTAKYNEVGQSLLSSVKKDPVKLSSIAQIVEGTPNPNLKNIVTVLEDGKPVNLQINDIEVLKSLEGLNKFNGDELDSAVKKITNVYKSLITTKNPVFAVRNIARDIPTYLINTKQSNPLKALGNLGIAAKDVATNADSFQQYKALGGGGSNFFDSNKVYKSANELRGNMGAIKKTLSKIDGGIETFNNIVESAPRLAEFKASLKKTGDVQQALFDSADVTTNFSRGGNIAKKIDVYTPYFNASIQGLDKFARQIKEAPIKTTIKGAAVITAPTLLINYMNKDNENYKALDNRTKDNYYLFPKEDGTFIKIPKSRDFGAIFGSLAERILRQSNGETNAFKGFGNTLSTSFSPSNPLDNIAKPIYDLAANKDFANRDIVPRAMIEDKRSPYLQYDEKTTEPAKAIAEAAKKANIDLSPKQIDYIVKSYTGVIAQLGQPLLTKSTMENGTTLEKTLKPVTTQFIADPLYSNQALTDFYDNVDSAKRTATDKNLIEKIPSKLQTNEEKVSSALTKASSELSDLNKQLKVAQEKDDKELIKTLRIKMLDIASKTNNLYNKNKK